MKFRRLAGTLIIASLLISGCASTTPAPPSYAPPDSMQLTVYTSHKESVYLPIVREFEERTGIWVDVVTGGTNELLDRISDEQDSPVADVMFGGGAESLLSRKDCFQPYVAAESGAIPDSYTSTDSCWTPFSALPVVLIYNTKLVTPSELTGWADLGRPQFRGKIAFADPRVSGSSYTALVTELFALEHVQEKPLQLLATALDGHILSDSGEVIPAVAGGKCLVGITLEQTAWKAISEGADIAMVYPSEGTSCVPDGSALVKNAPHSENAKLFLDFTVSRDVQQLLTDQVKRRSIRSDVPASSDLPSTEKFSLIPYDISWACENQKSILDTWSKLMVEDVQ